MQDPHSAPLSGRRSTDVDRVLYVDDDTLLQRAFSRLLWKRGLGVDTASCRSEALSLATDHDYSVIVTDLMLPDTDGVTLINELHSVRPDASFIITTGFDVEMRAPGGLEDRVACYVRKPWQESELRAALDQARESHRVRRSTRAPISRCSALIVEGNPADAHLTALQLEETGVCGEIGHCSALEQTLAVLRARSFDVIVTELELDDVAGVALIEQLRAAASDAALIVLTHSADEALHEQALRSGAQDCLSKAQTDTKQLELSVSHALTRVRADRRITYLTQHDPLTQLPNRAAFCQDVEAAIGRMRVSAKQCALMLLHLADLDALRRADGEDAAESVLCEIARRIKASVREQDRIGRAEPNGFMILIEELDDPQVCERVAKRLLSFTAVPILLRDEVDVVVKVHAGIALCQDGDLTAERLMQAAGRALQAAATSASGFHLLGPPELSAAEPRH